MYLVLKKNFFTKYFWIQIGINWSLCRNKLFQILSWEKKKILRRYTANALGAIKTTLNFVKQN